MIIDGGKKYEDDKKNEFFYFLIIVESKSNNSFYKDNVAIYKFWKMKTTFMFVLKQISLMEFHAFFPLQWHE